MKLVLILLLLLNTAIAAVYFLVLFRDPSKRGKGTVSAMFMLFCPAVGPLYLFTTWLFYFIWIRLGRREVNPKELSFSKEKVNLRVGTDVERDANRIPLEEALLVASARNKREVFLNVLKDDFEDSIETIKEAIDDEDSEISHYVASSIMDVTAKFKTNEKQLYEEYKEDSTLDRWKRYAVFVIEFLKKDLVTAPEKEKLASRLQEEMDSFPADRLREIGSGLMAELVDLWRKLGNYENAERWLNLGLSLEEDSLEIYKAGLKSYYAMGDREKFMQLMKRLKESTIIFDDEVLEWVRFFG